jgi:hypothetical protein
MGYDLRPATTSSIYNFSHELLMTEVWDGVSDLSGTGPLDDCSLFFSDHNPPNGGRSEGTLGIGYG